MTYKPSTNPSFESVHGSFIFAKTATSHFVKIKTGTFINYLPGKVLISGMNVVYEEEKNHYKKYQFLGITTIADTQYFAWLCPKYNDPSEGEYNTRCFNVPLNDLEKSSYFLNSNVDKPVESSLCVKTVDELEKKLIRLNILEKKMVRTMDKKRNLQLLFSTEIGFSSTREKEQMMGVHDDEVRAIKKIKK